MPSPRTRNVYNPALPNGAFGIVGTTEARCSVCKLWRQVLAFIDGGPIGLADTPSPQTFGFFDRNHLMECGHEQGAADGANFHGGVHLSRTAVCEFGRTVDAGCCLDGCGNLTREPRCEQLDGEITCDSEQLVRDKQAKHAEKIAEIVRDGFGEGTEFVHEFNYRITGERPELLITSDAKL